MVPISAVDEVREILGTFISDDQLEHEVPPEAQAESSESEGDASAGPRDDKGRGPRWLLITALFFFGAPDPTYLGLFRAF